MMKIFVPMFAIAVVATAMTQHASAVIIYSEDFSGLTPGTDTLADSSSDWTTPAGEYGVLAGGTVFTDNHIELTASAGNFNFANWVDGETRPILTFSLDLADLGGSTSADAGIRLSQRRNTGSAFTDATAANTPDNTIVHYDVVINTSAAPVLYEDGVNSIAANTLEIWIDGVLSSSVAANGSGGSIGPGLWNRRPDNRFLADNLVIRDTAFVVPEPSSFAMGLIGLCVCLRSQRRR